MSFQGHVCMNLSAQPDWSTRRADRNVSDPAIVDMV